METADWQAGRPDKKPVRRRARFDLHGRLCGAKVICAERERETEIPVAFAFPSLSIWQPAKQ